MKKETSDELLEAIREKTRELTQSKEKAREYLRESGIAEILENAKKREAHENHSAKNNEE